MATTPAPTQLLRDWLSAGDHPPAPWRDALLAGLPYFLYGLMLSGLYLVFTISPPGEDSWQSMLVNVLTMLLSLAAFFVVILARRRGWPTWAASWYPFAITSVIYLLQAISVLVPNLLNSSLAYIVSIAVQLGIFILAVYIFRRDRIASLLVVIYFFPMLALAVIDPIPYELGALICFSLGLLCGIAALLSTRWGRWMRGVGLCMAVNLIAGLMTFIVYSLGLVSLGFDALTPSELMGGMGIYLVVTLTLLLAPALIWGFNVWIGRLVTRH